MKLGTILQSLYASINIYMLIGSLDFLGLNYYTSQYAKDDPNAKGEGWPADQKVELKSYKGQTPIGTPSGSSWLFSVPWGIYAVLMHLNKYYPLMKELYITENGFSTATEYKKTAKMVCEDDDDRINYHKDHLANLAKAMKNIKYEVKGYFVWAWSDTYEWSSGYTVRFGLNYVDYANGLARYPKNSAAWFAKFLHCKVQPPAYFRPWWTWNPGKPILLEAREVDENVEISLTKG